MLENIGRANMPMFPIWDYFAKQPEADGEIIKVCAEWNTVHVAEGRKLI